MSLTQSQIRAFERDGYLIAENVFTDADLAPVIAAIDAFVEERAREYHAAGKIDNLFANEPFDKRLARMYEQAPEIVNGIDIMEQRTEALFRFLRSPRLLDALEGLIGPEITCNPIQHLRCKMPVRNSHSLHGNAPWHQDMAVTWKEADASPITTCWIPLIDATRETGCMEIIPGVHKTGYIEHISSSIGTTINPDKMPETKPICAECPKGGVVFMHRLTPHRGIDNTSGRIRWTIDLRYQPTGTPTGRPFYPDFVARSKAVPASELRDFNEWSRLWEEGLVAGQGQKWHRV